MNKQNIRRVLSAVVRKPIFITGGKNADVILDKRWKYAIIVPPPFHACVHMGFEICDVIKELLNPFDPKQKVMWERIIKRWDNDITAGKMCFCAQDMFKFLRQSVAFSFCTLFFSNVASHIPSIKGGLRVRVTEIVLK